MMSVSLMCHEFDLREFTENDVRSDVDKRDDRKPHSKPRLKRLGTLDEIAKLGLRGAAETILQTHRG